MKFTCLNMMYVEAGTPPLIVKIKTRVLLFWSSPNMCDEKNKYTKKYSIL